MRGIHRRSRGGPPRPLPNARSDARVRRPACHSTSPFGQQLVRGFRDRLARQAVVIHVDDQVLDTVRRDAVSQPSQSADRLPVRHATVTPRIPDTERFRRGLDIGITVTVQTAVLRPLLSPFGHGLGDVVDAPVRTGTGCRRTPATRLPGTSHLATPRTAPGSRAARTG